MSLIREFWLRQCNREQRAEIERLKSELATALVIAKNYQSIVARTLVK